MRPLLALALSFASPAIQLQTLVVCFHLVRVHGFLDLYICELSKFRRMFTEQGCHICYDLNILNSKASKIWGFLGTLLDFDSSFSGQAG